MRLYFAHSVTDYGTERQTKALVGLNKHFAEDLGRPLAIENPDQPHHQVGYAVSGMEYFKGVVEDCQALAFMRFPNGAIGAGAGREIGWALVDNLWLYEVFDGQVYRVDSMPTPVLSVEGTRALIAQLRHGRGASKVMNDGLLYSGS